MTHLAAAADRKKIMGQIVLRIEDEHGHHIIRKHFHPVNNHEYYTIEGYEKRPDDYQKPPTYYFPFSEEEVMREFKSQGKEWRVS